MSHKWREPPGGNGRPSGCVAVASSFDTSRDSNTRSKRQASLRHPLRPGERVPGCIRSDPDSVPADFDAAAKPIICRHWFGIEPPRPVGPIAAEVIAELPAENTAERGSRTTVDQKPDHYAELDPAALDATGGNHFPPMPLHEFCDG